MLCAASTGAKTFCTPLDAMVGCPARAVDGSGQRADITVWGKSRLSRGCRLGAGAPVKEGGCYMEWGWSKVCLRGQEVASVDKVVSRARQEGSFLTARYFPRASPARPIHPHNVADALPEHDHLQL